MLEVGGELDGGLKRRLLGSFRTSVRGREEEGRRV